MRDRAGGSIKFMHEKCNRVVIFENIREGYFAYCQNCEENVTKNNTFKFFPVELKRIRYN